MKFGKFLESNAYPPYRPFYIAYKELKSGIKFITGQSEARGQLAPSLQSSAGTPEGIFQNLIMSEISKIDSFVRVQSDALVEGARRMTRDFEHGNFSGASSKESLQEQTRALIEFVDINKTGFRKICKKFDRWNGSNGLAWFMSIVERSEFVDRRWILRVLVSISKISEGSKELSDQGVEQFKRTSFLFSPNADLGVLLNIATFMEFKDSDMHKEFSDVVTWYVAWTRTAGGGEVGAGLSPPSALRRQVASDPEISEFYRRSSNRPDSHSQSGIGSAFGVTWTGPEPFQPKNESRMVEIVREAHPLVSVPIKTGINGISWRTEISMLQFTKLVTGKLSLEDYARSAGLSDADSDLLEKFLAIQGYPSVTVKTLQVRLQGKDCFCTFERRFEISRSGNLFATATSRTLAEVSTIPPGIITIWTKSSSTSLPEFFEAALASAAVIPVPVFSKSVLGLAISRFSSKPEIWPSWVSGLLSSGSQTSRTPAVLPATTDRLLISRGSSIDILPEYPSISREISRREVFHSEPLLAAQSTARLPAPVEDVNDLSAPLLLNPGIVSDVPRLNFLERLKMLLCPQDATTQTAEFTAESRPIEPKTFLANERTFLDWLYLSFGLVVFAFASEPVGRNLMKIGSLITGLILIPLAMRSYYNRAADLTRMGPVERYGEIGIGSVLISGVGCLCTFCLIYYQVSDNHAEF